MHERGQIPFIYSNMRAPLRTRQEVFVYSLARTTLSSRGSHLTLHLIQLDEENSLAAFDLSTSEDAALSLLVQGRCFCTASPCHHSPSTMPRESEWLACTCSFLSTRIVPTSNPPWPVGLQNGHLAPNHSSFAANSAGSQGFSAKHVLHPMKKLHWF
jgi:hypothetical protein